MVTPEQRCVGEEEEILADRTLAVNVAAVVVIFFFFLVVGAEVEVLALEVEPLLEHDLGPEHLHRKRTSGAYQHHGTILATSLGCKFLFQSINQEKKRKPKRNFWKEQKEKQKQSGSSQQILMAFVSCKVETSELGKDVSSAYLGRRPPLLLHHHLCCVLSLCDASKSHFPSTSPPYLLIRPSIPLLPLPYPLQWRPVPVM
jgi:hypothetical protein